MAEPALLRSPLLDGEARLRHGLTTRAHGSLGPAGDPTAVEARSRAVRLLGGDPGRLVVPHQVHGDVVTSVRAAEAGRGHASGPPIPGCDGLVTSTAGVPLMVQGADCPLVAVVDPGVPALAVVHSGWRGTVARIAEVAVHVLLASGARRERLLAAVFPGIGACCYEVGDDVEDAFRDAFGSAAADWFVRPGGGGRAHVDLASAIAATLAGAGVAVVDRVAGCTACDGRLFSYRASGGDQQRHGLVALLV